MKVVIDTNVVVSAGLRGRNPKRVTDFIIESSTHEWIVSQEILDEYQEVIHRRKLKCSQGSIDSWLKVFSTLEIIEDNHIQYSFPQDPKDEKFIRCAIAANAHYFITGDGDFKGITEIYGTSIISVSDFFRIEIENS